MKSHMCRSTMSSMITDLPFKLTEASIVILPSCSVTVAGNTYWMTLYWSLWKKVLRRQMLRQS